ncbi:hypothetical protein, partial [Micromonospora olivasterospora]|uniref:hypothetical protein n=1 Tax=Micromonospora olivasterospora TaxID=1880 RepID=UPI0031D74F1C
MLAVAGFLALHLREEQLMVVDPLEIGQQGRRPHALGVGAGLAPAQAAVVVLQGHGPAAAGALGVVGVLL